MIFDRPTDMTAWITSKSLRSSLNLEDYMRKITNVGVDITVIQVYRGNFSDCLSVPDKKANLCNPGPKLIPLATNNNKAENTDDRTTTRLTSH